MRGYLISIAYCPFLSLLPYSTGYDQESYTVTGLEEYWEYGVTVTAQTSVGSNTSVMVNQRTLPSGRYI